MTTPADDQDVATTGGRARDRVDVIRSGLQTSAWWSLRIAAVAVVVVAVVWLLGRAWVGVAPVVLAVIVAAALWPAVRWLRAHRVPDLLAAVLVLGAVLGLLAGILVLVGPVLVRQSSELAANAGDGLQRVREWLRQPPVNLGSDQIDQAVAQVTDRLQSNATDIAGGVLTGVSAITSGLVTVLLVVVLALLFLKDGPKFLPWLRHATGARVGNHLSEVLARAFATVSDFIRVQAIVSAADAVLIGLGLVLLGVPVAPALAVLTFLGGFVPIVGAVAVGSLAVLVALVSEGLTTALLVLALILVVQQLEGNVLQPLLQGQSLKLHPALVLIAVTTGGSLFGIAGAFLAVPVVAVAATILRYGDEQIALRLDQTRPEEVDTVTTEGEAAAQQAHDRGTAGSD
ncbi:AI-2E family transporter [Auraticoccus monumenti]|uniref:Predicted PurR-regulated permease PerM n=1 Tax=Auraticoccus monumenti TaxID=675864 RepID=A0A1G6ZKN2_9ACTN|nr:AI-2E family transporter [Auraticoccus monumenti]SDE02126.1 Predicted PurR-regulated permease PerM [Auraticoccus monumenti]